VNRKEFERVSPESVGISSEAVMRFVDKLEGGHTEMHGLMIMRHGKICAEGWWAPFGPGIRHMCNSLTKTYMGTAIGIAYTEGLLKLDDRLVDIFPEYMPENPSPYIDKLTIRNVLCMGTGMTAMPRATADWVRDFIAMPIVHEPGTAFYYNSAGSTLLGKVIEKLTGLNVYDYLKTKLFDKIGIDSENIRYGLSNGEQDMWAWRIVSTTEDNLRLMKLYADGGVWDGERILAEDYVKMATTLQNDSSSEKDVNPPATDNFVGYGFQIWLCKHPGAYRADGAGGQFSIVIPDKDTIVSINENGSTPGGPQKTLDIVWEYLIPALQDEILPENPEALAALRRKMSHLAIEVPEFRPYAKWKKDACGFYAVKSGSFTLYGDVMGNPDKSEADSFRIGFETMEGRIEWLSKDRRRCIVNFAMDGTRRWNHMDSPWNFAVECWASGAWETDDTFRLELLWTESPGSRKILRFRFDAEGVTVLENAVSGPPRPGIPFVRETRAVRIR